MADNSLTANFCHGAFRFRLGALSNSRHSAVAFCKPAYRPDRLSQSRRKIRCILLSIRLLLFLLHQLQPQYVILLPAVRWSYVVFSLSCCFRAVPAFVELLESGC